MKSNLTKKQLPNNEMTKTTFWFKKIKSIL